MQDFVIAAALLSIPVVIGFAVVALATWPLVGWLKRRQLGKTFREDGPSHQGKAGTPTMGGLALVASIVICGLVVGVLGMRWLDDPQRVTAAPDMLSYVKPALLRILATTIGACLGFGLIGLLDDWHGLARKGLARELGVGLGARQALALQVVIAIVLALVLAPLGEAPPMSADAPGYPVPAHLVADRIIRWIWLPPASVVGHFGLVVWLCLAVGITLGTVNGVNLSDGLDGLAAGLAFLAFAAFGLSLVRWHPIYGPQFLAFVLNVPIAALCLFIAGACLGFLVHNRYPARVFMGNVTSMALGGALATIALATGTWLLLPIIGVVYVAEVLSDIIQIGYFKWSGGKRVFRMAPLHHHFELGGMHETAVTRRFWLAGAIGAAVAVGFVYYATWGV